MATYRMTIEYEGTDFAGWQFQQNGRSVQETIENALKQILQQDIRIAGGGRTDAGVHAVGQVASFRLETDIDHIAVEKGLNAVLPHDVVVFDLKATDDNFHARYSAKARTYEYSIVERPISIGRLYSWYVHFNLDLNSMQRCAQYMIGEHNFQSFSKANGERELYLCTIDQAEWTNTDGRVLFKIRANHFLYGMVRALVGTMVEIGRGYRPEAEFEKILLSHDRALAGMYAPAKGLCLKEIIY